MADEQAQTDSPVELSDGAEYKVLANIFGIMLASAGLLAGTMFRERSVDYWQDDMVSLLLLLFSGRGFIKNSMQLVRDTIVYSEKKQALESFLSRQHQVFDENAGPVNADALPAQRKQYSEEEVLEAVGKRIQEQKDKAVKKFAEGG